MSIATEIQRIKNNVLSAFAAVTAKGGTYTDDNSDNLTEAIASIPQGGGDVTVVPLTASENGTYTAPDGFAYSPITVDVQGGGGESHIVELTSDGSTIAEATDVFAADVPQTGTYFYILSRPASGHPFYPTSGARFVMAIFVDGSLKGNVGYRSASNGVISGYSPTVAANSYAGDKYTRLEVV